MALPSRKSGFSLIELLIAMLIAVSLYAVAVGPTRAYMEKQKLQRCAENLRRLHLTLSLYANEHDGAYPQVAGARNSDDAFALLGPQYSTDTSIFVCPATGKPASTGGHVDYAYVMGLRKDAGSEAMLLSDAQVDTGPKRHGTNVFSDSGNGPGSNHGKAGGNLLFADGHVETVGSGVPRDLPVSPETQLLNPAP